MQKKRDKRFGSVENSFYLPCRKYVTLASRKFILKTVLAAIYIITLLKTEVANAVALEESEESTDDDSSPNMKTLFDLWSNHYTTYRNED